MAGQREGIMSFARINGWVYVAWRWFRVIWVCRVPFVSAVAAGWLLAAAPQARDLFADIGFGWLHWLAFFTLLFAWSWVVHASARRALQHDEWVEEAHVAGGLSQARRKQLQDEFYLPAVVAPRVLGLAVFFFAGWAMCRTRRNLLGAMDGLPEASEAAFRSTVLLAITIALTIIYVVAIWKPRLFRFLRFAHKDRAVEPPLLTGTPQLFAGPNLAARLKAHVARTIGSPVDVGLVAARALILIVLVITIVDPHFVATLLPRLFFAPVLFAGLVLLLGEVAAWSHRVRTPLLLLLIGLAGGFLYFIDRFHDVRWTGAPARASSAMGEQQHVPLAEAVRRWKLANECLPEHRRPCPRPIVIAGAGGASRAAFLTATVVGALIDLGQDPEKAAIYGDVHKRIFALSTVSGSSAGALVVRAALADAAEIGAPTRPPCTTEGAGSWFGKFAKGVAEPGVRFDPTRSWRDCFQLILAGDFLSPVMVGLAYRDTFPLGNPFSGTPLWPDRAALLEQGFERRYHRVTSPHHASLASARSCRNPPAQGPAHPADDAGLCRRFGYHPDPAKAGEWLPLLFINGTSVSTGRRIIVGDVCAADRFAPKRTLFPFAYDLNEIATWSKKPNVDPKEPKVDPCEAPASRNIRLSTAATMSARFPIISPHGNLRDRDGDVADRIVDGGYFENDGLATAADITDALKHEQFGLQPVIIRVVNEPARLETRRLGPDRPLIPDEEERAPFDGITSIFRALTATRSGHEEGHAAYAKSVVGEHRLYAIGVYELEPPQSAVPDQKKTMPLRENPLCRQVVRKRAAMGHVSMSWWMSQSVQAYLDAQLCVKANWERLECELRKGRSAKGGDCIAEPPVLEAEARG
jgi:hypothetical protein